MGDLILPKNITADFDVQAHCAHMERVMQLAVLPEWRAEIAASFTLTTAAAVIVLDFPLDDSVEPAPIYEA